MACPPLPVVVGPQVIGAAGPGDVSLPISSSAQGELESQTVSGPSAPPSSVTARAAALAVLIPPPMANGDSEEVVAAFISLLAAEAATTGDQTCSAAVRRVG